MTKPFLILQHHAVETPGAFVQVLNARNVDIHVIRPDLGLPVPANLERYAGLIAMGGPMGVYEEDRYPWLRDEDRLLKLAIAADLPVLGICLGSQLIAKAAGATVAPGPEGEIGWYPLTLTEAGRIDPALQGLPATFDALEWHGDIFDLPAGAVCLARSARYPHQAFRFGRRVYGLLFHLEATAAMVRSMTETFRAEVIAFRGAAYADEILADVDRRGAAANAHARRFMENFLTLAPCPD